MLTSAWSCSFCSFVLPCSAFSRASTASMAAAPFSNSSWHLFSSCFLQTNQAESVTLCSYNGPQPAANAQVHSRGCCLLSFVGWHGSCVNILCTAFLHFQAVSSWCSTIKNQYVLNFLSNVCSDFPMHILVCNTANQQPVELVPCMAATCLDC